MKEIEELYKYCDRNGIFVYEEDFDESNGQQGAYRNRNVVFKKKDNSKEFKIHLSIFRRYSGIHSIKKEIKEGFSDFYPVDNQMFYMGFIKSSINKAFGIENQ